MRLADEIRAVIAEMPLKDQQIINATHTALRYTCALADELGKPDKMFGVTAAPVELADENLVGDAAAGEPNH